MIRRTLAQTKAGTFCVLLPDESRQGMPTPTGTGFFVSEDGWFVTAAHVVTDSTGNARNDVDQAWLQGTPESEEAWGIRLVQHPSLEFLDPATDIAFLKCDFQANREKDWLKARDGFPCLRVAARELDEGEPVYAFGFPLSGGALVRDDPQITVASTTLSPRVTSAVVSSRIEHYGMVESTADAKVYVLDKALNYGNSGGPIVATDTGCAHAVCTRFQPLFVPQPVREGETSSVVVVPSLYGIVSSLADPRLTAAFAKCGVVTVT